MHKYATQGTTMAVTACCCVRPFTGHASLIQHTARVNHHGPLAWVHVSWSTKSTMRSQSTWSTIAETLYNKSLQSSSVVYGTWNIVASSPVLFLDSKKRTGDEARNIGTRCVSVQDPGTYSMNTAYPELERDIIHW